MNKRTEREKIIQVLYTIDLTKNDIEKVAIHDSEINFKIIDIIKDVQNSICSLDNTIERNLKDWKLNRLSFVDRAIIRYATYEMVNNINPFEVIINEAIELTKKFTDIGDGKSKSFNNKLLDNIKNDVYANE